VLRQLLFAFVLALAPATACQDAVTTTIGGRLNLNRATVKELEALPGIGPKLARSIMASRNARGGRFQHLDDLLEINGIGTKTLAEIRPHVVVE
jgi:competence protein ComEA